MLHTDAGFADSRATSKGMTEMDRAGFSQIFSQWLKPRRAELAFSLRVTVAAVLALVVARFLALPMPLWSVLTAVIVNQLSSGRSLSTGANYLLGTIGGSIYGGIIALLLPHSSEAMLLGVLVIAVAPPALYSARHANMNVVPISAIIVLLMPALGQGDPLHSTIDRILEVAVGAVIGLVVALLLLPSSAYRQTREAAAGLLDDMAQALVDLGRGVLDGMALDDVNRVQDRIGAMVTALDALGGEADQERSARLASGAETAPLRRTLLRLRHDLVFVGRAVGQPVSDDMRIRLRPRLDDVVATGSAFLRASAAALRQGGSPPSLDAFRRALDAYVAGMAAMHRDGSTMALSGDAAERFFAATFALEQMGRNFADLERLVSEWQPNNRKGR